MAREDFDEDFAIGEIGIAAAVASVKNGADSPRSKEGCISRDNLKRLADESALGVEVGVERCVTCKV